MSEVEVDEVLCFCYSSVPSPHRVTPFEANVRFRELGFSQREGMTYRA